MFKDGPSPRILKQTSQMLNDPIQGVDFSLDPNNFRHFLVNLQGQTGTLYEGGLFKVELTLPEDYPMNPPKAEFNTKIYHPNINQQGVINLSILGYTWSPALQIRSVIISIRSLLRHPNANDAYEDEIGRLWKSDLISAQQTARESTKKYAQT